MLDDYSEGGYWFVVGVRLWFAIRCSSTMAGSGGSAVEGTDSKRDSEGRVIKNRGGGQWARGLGEIEAWDGFVFHSWHAWPDNNNAKLSCSSLQGCLCEEESQGLVGGCETASLFH